jgi:hypothetical protein
VIDQRRHLRARKSTPLGIRRITALNPSQDGVAYGAYELLEFCGFQGE